MAEYKESPLYKNSFEEAISQITELGVLEENIEILINEVRHRIKNHDDMKKYVPEYAYRLTASEVLYYEFNEHHYLELIYSVDPISEYIPDIRVINTPRKIEPYTNLSPEAEEFDQMDFPSSMKIPDHINARICIDRSQVEMVDIYWVNKY